MFAVMSSTKNYLPISLLSVHCVKSVQIRSFFWSVFSRIRTEYGPEKTPYLDPVHAVVIISKIFENSSLIALFVTPKDVAFL